MMRVGRGTQIARENAVSQMVEQDRVTLSADDRVALEQAEQDIRNMNPALRSVYEELRTMLQDDSRNNVMFFYNIGQILYNVKADRSGEQYGKKAYKKLLDCLQYPPVSGSKAVVFASEYDEEEVQGIIAMQNPATGRKLTVEHLRHLLVDRFSDAPDPDVRLAETKEARRGYMLRCIHGGWTSKYLAEVIKRETGTLRSGGRPNAGSTNKNAALQDVIMYYVKGNKSMSKEWLGDTSNLVDNLTRDMTGVTEDTIGLYDTMMDTLQQHKEQLNELLTQLEAADIKARYINHVGHLEADAAVGAGIAANSAAAHAAASTTVSAVELPDIDSGDLFIEELLNGDD